MSESDLLRCGLFVDIDAVRHNIEELRRLSNGRKILCTVKANAYGHGMSGLARGIKDTCDMFSVATVDEGVRLRTLLGPGKPILVLGPVSPKAHMDALKYGLSLTLFDMKRALLLEGAASELEKEMSSEKLFKLPYAFRDMKAHIHIAVDTGMTRIGLAPDGEGLSAVRGILGLPHIAADGIFTHFAVADDDIFETKKAYESFRDFKKLCVSEGIEIPVWHAANTAGVINGIGTDTDMDMVRLGIGIYGLYPSASVDRTRVSLKRPHLWYAYVTMVKEIRKGTKVGYGYTFEAPHDMKIATVSAGYADGLPRVLSNRGRVIIAGQYCPIIGSICMDQLMADISGTEGVEAGAPVVLMGACGEKEITAEEIASDAGTINYEIVCGIAARVARSYIDRNS